MSWLSDDTDDADSTITTPTMLSTATVATSRIAVEDRGPALVEVARGFARDAAERIRSAGH